MRRVVLACLLLFVSACAGPSVYVVRHAEAFKNLKPRPDLPADRLDSLTERGITQAEHIAIALHGRDIAAVFHSPTGRTTETATIVGRALGVPVHVAPELASLRGPWDGREAAWSNGTDLRPDGGESMADGIARALGLVRRHPNASIVVVTHGDIAAGLIGEAAGTPVPERWGSHAPAGGTWTRVTGLR